MKYEVKSIGIWPFIKVSFFFNLIVGFVFGLFYALFAGFIMTVMSRLSQFQPGGFDFDVGAMPIGLMLVVMPIMFAIIGAVFYTMIGTLVVLIYNLIAKIVGGYELVMEPVGAVVPATPPAQPLTGYTGGPSYAPPPPQPDGSPGTSQAPPSQAPESDDRETDQNRQE